MPNTNFKAKKKIFLSFLCYPCTSKLINCLSKLSDNTETWEFHNFPNSFCSRGLNLVTVLNYKNSEFHPMVGGPV